MSRRSLTDEEFYGVGSIAAVRLRADRSEHPAAIARNRVEAARYVADGSYDLARILYGCNVALARAASLPELEAEAAADLAALSPTEPPSPEVA